MIVIDQDKAAAILSEKMVNVVQRHLDAKASERNYDNIVSACSYAGAPNDFQAESQAYLKWRAAVWKHCYAVMDAVLAGNRPVPAEAELLAELPVLVLPS